MKLGTNIRRIRELRNMKQEYITQHLKLSVTSYGKIERGETDLSINRLSKIPKKLKVPLIMLINFNDQAIFEAINYVRLIMSSALLCNATRIAVAHNHPSATLTPSSTDRSLTNKIIEAGKVLDIQPHL